jgi:hypothetical protein
MAQLPNQASFELDDSKNTGEAKIILRDREIGFVHAQLDNPKAEFDLIVEDMAGNEQLVRRNCKNPTGRWGERIDLPVNDNYCKVRVENVRGAKKLDLFFE